jgi:hypothetical protein
MDYWQLGNSGEKVTKSGKYSIPAQLFRSGKRFTTRQKQEKYLPHEKKRVDERSHYFFFIPLCPY